MQDGPDFLDLGIFLLFVLIILATVVIFLRGVGAEIRLRLAARKRRIDMRPGFPLETSPEDRPETARATGPRGPNP
jgi:hypothetical protein